MLAIFAAWKIYDAARDAPRGTVFAMIVAGQVPLDDRAKAIAPVLGAMYSEYRENARQWSFVYYCCVFGAAISSALAGLILKLEYFIVSEGLKKDLAACLAVLAAFLAAISTSGNFHDKWQANRLAASQAEALAFGLTVHPFTSEHEQAMYAALRELTLTRNLQIVGQARPKEGKADDGAASAVKNDAHAKPAR
jgi:hypothetical protein